MKPSRHAARNTLLSVLFVAGGAILYTSFFYDRGIDPFDEGLYATEAWRILEGRSYGGDFLAPYGPGRYYLIALFFALFGMSLKVQAVVFLLLRGLVAAVMFLVSRRFLSLGWALVLAAAVTLAPGALHKGFFQAVVLVDVAAYLFYRGRPGPKRAFLAGLAAGGGALFRVDAGVFGALCFLVLAGLEPWWEGAGPSIRSFASRAGPFLLGALLPTLPVACALWWGGSPADLLSAEARRVANLSRFPAALSLPGGAAAAASLKKALLAVMIPGAPAALLLLALWTCFSRIRGRGRGAIEFLALSLYGLTAMNQLRITPTFNHLLQCVPPALVAATLLLLRFGGRDPGFRGGDGEAAVPAVPPPPGFMPGRAALAAALLPAALVVFYNLSLTRPGAVLTPHWANRRAFTAPVDLDRAGVFATPREAAELENVVDRIRENTSPGDTLLAGPFCPVVYFLAGRLPAVRVLEPFYYFDDLPMQRRMVVSLEENPPPLVVLGGEPNVVGGRSLERDAPLLYRYITSRYRPWLTVGRFRILKRKE